MKKRMVKIRRLLYLTVVASFVAMMLASCETGSGYRNDGKQVTWHSWDEGNGHRVFVVDADPSTFEDLGDGYARDAQHVFLEGDIIKGADGKTFKYLEKRYAIDANHVFHYDTIMTVADLKSFKVHGWFLAEDKKDFYWNGNAIHVADKKTFFIFGDENDWDTRWAKDKENAYCMGYAPVPLADFESFHPIGHEKNGCLSGYYAADKYRVYYQDHFVDGADPETFAEIEFEVGQDRNRVYKEWKATEIKDFNQLSQIGNFYSDGMHIYTSELELFEVADPKTFRQIEESSWYVDKDHVWYNGGLVKDADKSTIQPVRYGTFYNGEKQLSACSSYGKDKSYVFYKDSIIPGADPASFEIIDFDGSWTVFDKNRIYEGKNSKELQYYLRDKYGRKQ